MSEKIEHSVSGRRTCQHNPVNCFQRFLSVAPGNIFFHSVENLLNIDPHVAGTNVLGPATLDVLGHLPVDVLVVTSKNLWDFGVLHGEGGATLDIIKELLPNWHPVVLGSVAPLISHRDEGSGLHAHLP